MIRAIIFDLYGVLAINGWQAFKAEHFSEREDVWDQVFQMGRQVDAGLIDYAELIQFTARVSGETEGLVRHQLEHTVVNAELLDFIHAELRGRYRLGVLSNASSDEVIKRIFTPKQKALFDVIMLSHHVGTTKPDIRMYGAVSEELGVGPSDCVFIDDQKRHVDGAHAAGMHALVYTDVARLKDKLTLLVD